VRAAPCALTCWITSLAWSSGNACVPAGYRQAKATHIGKQKVPTWVQMYTARGQSVGHRCAGLLLFLDSGLATVCPPSETEAGSAGTQPARDSSADGVPLVHPKMAPAHVGGPGACFLPPGTSEDMPAKIPGVWGQSPQGFTPQAACYSLARPPSSSCSSSTHGSGSFRHSSRRSRIGASSDPVTPQSCVPPGTHSSTR
jgi:hypothetical protein